MPNNDLSRGGRKITSVLASCLCFIATSLPVFAAQDPWLILGAPVWTNHQVRFTLTGESSVKYVIEWSPDLQNWAAVVTNSDFCITRAITLAGTNPAGFFRANRGPRSLGALTARESISFMGNNIVVDSYDSADPDHSAGGRYDPARRKSGGDVATVNGSIEIGNANIYGHVYTAPWGNTSTLANGRVGDLPPSPSYPNGWAGFSGIQDGWYRNDYNAVLRDVTAPDFSSGALPIAQNDPKFPGYETNSYTLGSGNYFVSGDFKIGNNETLYVTGNATLWVQGSFSMSGLSGSYITIAPGYTLKVYVGTENVAQPVSASFASVNQLGPDANAWNFQYYGLPSNTNLVWYGNSPYMGTVYAPEAIFTLSGTTTNDYHGAWLAKSITVSGRCNIHFDEHLTRGGPVR